MTFTEQRAALSLAAIFGCRMLGLFMILPVFSLYAHDLNQATPLLIGLAMGIYGFTQALMQIPFGALSDRIGRKPIIAMGLVIFAIGSVIAATSHHIYGTIAGRAIQGAGAIGSTTIALLADLTHEDNRSKALALVGMVIGCSFMLAMIIGPIMTTWVGVNGIFWLTALLAILGLITLYTVVPKPAHHYFHRDSQPVFRELPRLLTHPQLLCLDVSVFVQHALLTAIFVVLPVMLHHNGLLEAMQWQLYLPVMLLAFGLSLPCIIVGEKKRQLKPLMLLCISIIGVSQLAFWLLSNTTWGIAAALTLFFTAFSTLEAILPSLMSKLAPAGRKGTATGIYSTAQFLGIFVGGLAAGALYQHAEILDVFLFCLLLSALWLILISKMQPPAHVSSLIASLEDRQQTESTVLKQEIQALPGVIEVAVAKEENTVYLKIDKDSFDKDRLQCLLHPE